MSQLSYDVELQPGEILQLPESVVKRVGPGRWRIIIAPVNDEVSTMTFEAYLRTMPDVGTDTDFSRIEGSIRDVDLAN